MRSALESVAGVEKVDVDYKAKTATVHCSSDCDPKDLVAALEGTKFGAMVK